MDFIYFFFKYNVFEKNGVENSKIRKFEIAIL